MGKPSGSEEVGGSSYGISNSDDIELLSMTAKSNPTNRAAFAIDLRRPHRLVALVIPLLIVERRTFR